MRERTAWVTLERDPQRFWMSVVHALRNAIGVDAFVQKLEPAPTFDGELVAERLVALRTSVLARVTGLLAEVLSGGSGSERILHELEEQNAFVVSLDASRSGFRYHSLFADLLRLEPRRTEPEAIPELHRRAASGSPSDGPPSVEDLARASERGSPESCDAGSLPVARVSGDREGR